MVACYFLLAGIACSSYINDAAVCFIFCHSWRCNAYIRASSLPPSLSLFSHGRTQWTHAASSEAMSRVLFTWRSFSDLEFSFWCSLLSLTSTLLPFPSIRNIGKTETHPHSSASRFLLYPTFSSRFSCRERTCPPDYFFPINSTLMVMLHASSCVRPEVLHSFLPTLSSWLIPEHDLFVLSPLYVPLLLSLFVFCSIPMCIFFFVLRSLHYMYGTYSSWFSR